MQVVEKLHEGLSRAFGVLVPASELGERLEARIARSGRPSASRLPAGQGPQPLRRIYGQGADGRSGGKDPLGDLAKDPWRNNQLRIAASPT